MPYSGPLSSYGTIGRAHEAFFAMVNRLGGVGGRALQLVSLDDGFNPAKTVEHTRRLVEQDKVAFVFGSLGTATNAAVQRYLNERNVPQLFITTAASRWADPAHFPWTMPWSVSYATEARALAAHLLQTRPRARVGVLYQNDDFGKDFLTHFRDALGNRASEMVVAEASYAATDPTVDSQIVTLRASGADTLFDVAAPRTAGQVIRKVRDLGWDPLHLLVSASTSIPNVLRPAGLEAAKGVVSASHLKDPADPAWDRDSGMQAYRSWLETDYPSADPMDTFNVFAYSQAQTLLRVLEQCDGNFSRENVMRQAANLRDVALPLLLPGIQVRTSPTDYRPIEALQLQRFDGQRWARFGSVVHP